MMGVVDRVVGGGGSSQIQQAPDDGSSQSQQAQDGGSSQQAQNDAGATPIFSTLIRGMVEQMMLDSQDQHGGPAGPAGAGPKGP